MAFAMNNGENVREAVPGAPSHPLDFAIPQSSDHVPPFWFSALPVCVDCIPLLSFVL
jgi:hypothetical protein